MSKLRETILNIKDIKIEKVFVPEWNVEVEVRGLSGAARNRILSKAIDNKGNINFDAMYPDLIVASLFDPELNEPIFKPEVRDAINAKSGKALERISRVAMKLSGLDDGQIDEKVKN
ncbi:hypothetical protein CU633_01835 [Bacillus sp. V3-13]|uniref:hypothetical protein n=1 Tax=Bacillus sp. V3-13 TaxID=2053728 RepID=UPI000C783594|nr:hypothetical protein [Bacillus sp. V3-13]PLR79132.1 hypothetical protein CU633_01835 [Bacillus sp. V3-13]